jgi:DNA recombination-dependent growth factor C
MPKTQLQKDAEKAIEYMERQSKEMESKREKNAIIRETKDKAKSEEMKSAIEKNAIIRETKDKAKSEEMKSAIEKNARIREAEDKAKSEEMKSKIEESAKKYGYKKGGLVRQGKPKLAKKGWR